jgi:hypothetical protein
VSSNKGFNITHRGINMKTPPEYVNGTNKIKHQPHTTKHLLNKLILHNYLDTNLIQDCLHFPSTALLALKYKYYIQIMCMTICYYHNLTLFVYLFPTGPPHHSSRRWLRVQFWVEGTLVVKLQVDVLGMWTLWLDGLPQKANQAAHNKSRDNGIKVDWPAPLCWRKTVSVIYWRSCMITNKRCCVDLHVKNPYKQRTINYSTHKATSDCLNITVIHCFAYCMLVSPEDGPATC